jgi:phosphatidylglycerol:prolipoprotein diacylglycerol transferase
MFAKPATAMPPRASASTRAAAMLVPRFPSLLAAELPRDAVQRRIGCFLVGDDYGRPTDLPWGIAFPEGLPPTDVPVHPTQLYEAFLLAPLAWMLLRWRRNRVPDAIVLGRYLILAGAFRFGIEFSRVNLEVLGPFTVAQLISASLILVGAVLSMQSRNRRRVMSQVWHL